ncbi:MAG: membrane protein insertase YidC [bacterium]
MEKRLIIAFVLSMVIIIGYTLITSSHKKTAPTKEKGKEETVVVSKETGAGLWSEIRSISETKTIPEEVIKGAPTLEGKDIVESLMNNEKFRKDVTIESPLYKIKIDGGEIKFAIFKKYHREDDQPLFVSDDKNVAPLHIDFSNKMLQDISKMGFFTDSRDVILGENDKVDIVFYAGGVERGITKKFSFSGDDYRIYVNIIAPGFEKEIRDGFAISCGSYTHDIELADKYRWNTRDVQAEIYTNNEMKKEPLGKGDGEKTYSVGIDWCSLSNKYFLSTIIPNNRMGTVKIIRKKNSYISVDLNMKSEGEFVFYLCPKEYDRLKEYNIGLEKTVNLGWSWIAPISKLFLIILKWFYNLFKNYGVGIVLLSIILKIILLPLTITSYRSSKMLQLLQPKIKEIQAKFKNDQQRMNMEIMALYKKYRVNPLSGCLPLLIQMPIFIALWNTLNNAIELKGSSFILWINDLSKPDALFKLPFKIPILNTYNFSLLPILMVIAMIYQQKTGGVSAGTEQQKLMAFLPIIFGFIFYNFPSGLVLYWLLNTIMSIIEQKYIVKPIELEERR